MILNFDELKKISISVNTLKECQEQLNCILSCRVTGTVFLESNVNLGNIEIISSENNGVFIGRYSYINHGGIIRDNVYIGRYCSIGRRVSIGATHHPYQYLSTHPFVSTCILPRKQLSKLELENLVLTDGKKVKLDSSPTIIMHDVWIGDGAVIIGGVKIGEGAVIGANCVVTKDVPPYSIVVGVPGQVINFRFRENIIHELLEIQWWNLNHTDIITYTPATNIIESIEVLKAIGKNLPCNKSEKIIKFTN